MSRSTHGGRHELGQNFLHDRRTIDRMVALARDAPGAILEIGAGDGALTVPLSRLRRDLRAVEIDEHRARRLRERLPTVDVRTADALRVPFDRDVVIGNVPFHLTTPILRKLLEAPGWRYAVLLLQWEVARRRAGVGGGTLMTAQAAPWFEFELRGRVARHAFRPVPGVDGGLLVIRRRARPLAPVRDRDRYERFVRSVFTGRGRGLGAVLERVRGMTASTAREALRAAGLPRSALPRDVTAEQWAAIWDVAKAAGAGASRRAR